MGGMYKTHPSMRGMGETQVKLNIYGMEMPFPQPSSSL